MKWFLCITGLLLTGCTFNQVKDPLGLEQGRKTSAAIETQVSKINVDRYNEAADSLTKAAKEVERTSKEVDVQQINHISRSIEDSVDTTTATIRSIKNTLVWLLWITISILWIMMIGRTIVYFRRK